MHVGREGERERRKGWRKEGWKGGEEREGGRRIMLARLLARDSARGN